MNPLQPRPFFRTTTARPLPGRTPGRMGSPPAPARWDARRGILRAAVAVSLLGLTGLALPAQGMATHHYSDFIDPLPRLDCFSVNLIPPDAGIYPDCVLPYGEAAAEPALNADPEPGNE